VFFFFLSLSLSSESVCLVLSFLNHPRSHTHTQIHNTCTCRLIALAAVLVAKMYSIVMNDTEEWWVRLILVRGWDVVPMFGNLVCLALLRVFDTFFAPRAARWFAIHAFANLFVVVFCIHGLIAVISDPPNAMNVNVHPDTPSTFELNTFGATSRWVWFSLFLSLSLSQDSLTNEMSTRLTTTTTHSQSL